MRKLTLSAALLAATIAQANEYTPMPSIDMDDSRQRYMQMQLDRIETMQRQQLLRQEYRDQNCRGLRRETDPDCQ